MSSESGVRLGRYSLIRRLAVGGMAELFLARSTGSYGFEKLVVLKRILPSFAENPAFTQMFLGEARLAAGLDHPNIAHVFDFGEYDGALYFTMEYVRGRDVRQLVREARDQNKPLPLAVVIHIIVGMLAGLHHAHEHRDPQGRPLQIVHRDISPANALVTYEGDVKLVDFGIAKAAALGPATVGGSLKGKISYMSPEQCRGEALDRRSDLFSIGTLLWELTVGKRLFGLNNATNELTLLRTIDEANVPRPREVVPSYPAELEAIVLRSLARDPADRFQTALEFRVALEAFAREARLPLSSATTAAFMGELFPPESREEPVAPADDGGTVTATPATPHRQPSATHTLPGDELTKPERSGPLPIDPGMSDVRPVKSQRALPVVLGLAVVALVSAGAFALLGRDRGPAETEVAPASVVPEAREAKEAEPEIEPETKAVEVAPKVIEPVREAEPEVVETPEPEPVPEAVAEPQAPAEEEAEEGRQAEAGAEGRRAGEGAGGQAEARARAGTRARQPVHEAGSGPAARGRDVLLSGHDHDHDHDYDLRSGGGWFRGGCRGGRRRRSRSIRP